MRPCASGSIKSGPCIDSPFEDISRPAGITASHISTPEQHYIIESMNGGIALFDCDDDGKLDNFSEVRAGSSYLSQNDLRQHFGLAASARIDSAEIRWPNGNVETLQNLATDAIYTIVEGEGIRETKPLPPPLE